METFFGLALAFDAALAGGNMPTIFNAANEEAVAAFLRGDISFVQIPEIISAAMMEVDFIDEITLDDIFNTEKKTREFVLDYISVI
jgi:1-deoxy-D-xylulose-5-phosphate reductoisomerase